MNGIIIGTFFTGMIVIGIMSIKRIKGSMSYFVADRKGNTAVIAGSLLATMVGGSMTMGLAGLGYSKGLVGAWWMLVGVIGLLVLAFWLAGKVRKTAVFTLPELLVKQYGGNTTRIIASLLISMAWLGIVAAQIIAAGKIMSIIWPGHLNTFMVLAAAIFIGYTVLGGQYSILRTDFIQATCIVAGIVACVWISISATGGVENLMNQLPEGHRAFPFSAAFTVTDFLLFLFFVGATFLVGPDIYSRILCAESPEVAKRAVIIAALTMIPLAFLITFIGIAARVLLPDIQAESSFPALVMSILPAGVNGLMIATLLAAVMSSADTCLLTTSTIVTTDIINPLFKSRLSDRSILAVSRSAVIVIGLISLVIALLLRGVIASLLLGYTVYSGGLVVPVLFGFYRERFRLNTVGAVASIIGGGGLALVLKLTGHNDLLLITLPASAFLLFAGSFAGRGRWSGKEKYGTEYNPTA